MRHAPQPKPPVGPLYQQLTRLRDALESYAEEMRMNDDPGPHFDTVLDMIVELSWLQDQFKVPDDIRKYTDRFNEIEDFIVNNLGVE